MATKINLAAAIGEEIRSFSQKMSNWIGEISCDPNLIQKYVVTSYINKSEFEALITLFKQNQNSFDSSAQENISKYFLKIKKKIDLADRVIKFVSSESKELNPRVENLMSQLESKKDLTPEKIRKYIQKVDQLYDVEPLKFNKEIIRGIQQELNTRLLTSFSSNPNFNICPITSESILESSCPYYLESHRPYFSHHLCRNEVIVQKGEKQRFTIAEIVDEETVEGQEKTSAQTVTLQEVPKSTFTIKELVEKGREQTLISYFETMLDSTSEMQASFGSSDFVHNLIQTAYIQVGIDLENGTLQTQTPSPRYLDEDLDFPQEVGELPPHDPWNQKLARYETFNTIDLPRKMTCEHVLESLLLLNSTKLKNDLSGLGILITLGDGRKLGMIIHSDDHITLLDQYGDDTTLQCPYLVTFGGLKQAALFLHSQISKTPKGSSSGLFTLCNRRELVKIRERNERELEELSPQVAKKALAPPPPPEEKAPEEPLPPKEILGSLQKTVSALLLQTEEGFHQAIESLLSISGQQGRFITTNHNQLILNEIYFQLLMLQDEETKQKVIENQNAIEWGSDAFSEFDATNNAQKMRAAQRVQVDLLLLLLNQSFESADLKNEIPDLLKRMEELKLDPMDLPKGEKNLAHFLFSSLYKSYLAAWEKDKKLVHPHDKSFKSDFGRNALLGQAKDSIADTYKLAALAEVVGSLKEHWKI